MSVKPEQLIVALDVPDSDRADHLIDKLAPLGVSFKIGLELFMKAGPAFVSNLSDEHKVFLDLKFHDIPNTVAAAVKTAAALGVWMLNVHASGGREMMLAAAQALEGLESKPYLLAVTVLTSMNDQQVEETGSRVKVSQKVPLLARLAAECDFDGVVCSPREIIAVKQAVDQPIITVTPGVRPAGKAQNDQARIGTPAEVINAGGDFLVVGRPVTASADPALAAREILQEIEVPL
ncbi:MAG: orotidine-5'-phosphate decarboxylase [Bacillota bacterium]